MAKNMPDILNQCRACFSTESNQFDLLTTNRLVCGTIPSRESTN